jgi:hypothetical protein
MRAGGAITAQYSQARQHDVSTPHQLLMKAMAEKNIPFNFVTSRYFKAYVLFISKRQHEAPSRYKLIQMLDFLTGLMDQKVTSMATKSSHISAQFDSWTYGNHKITAMTMSLSGTCVFANAYENWSADTAINSAAAVHACLLDAIGLPPDTPDDNDIIPLSKLSGVTSDTTAVMPATVKELAKTRLAKGAAYNPCGIHVINLLLLDQAA